MSTLVVQRPRWRPALVLVICFFGALSGIKLLYDDLHRTAVVQDGPSIGAVQSTQRSVRRKSRGSFLWTDLPQGALVWDHDSVLVGAESGAVLQLDDGARLEIGENSLIVLKEVRELTTALLRGPIAPTSRSKESHGSFVLRRAGGDSLIRLEKGGQQQVLKLSFRLTSPASQAAFPVSSGSRRKVEFQWVASGKAAPGTLHWLEISSNPDFSAPARKRLASGTLSTHASFPAGRYFWRLGSSDRTTTETRAFQVTAVPRARALSTSFDTDGGVRQIGFHWEAAETAPGIETVLEVSHGADFKTVALTIPVSMPAGGARISDLPVGGYFWRLKSRQSDIEVPSNAIAFGVTPPKPIVPDLLDAPSEAMPVDGYAFHKETPRSAPTLQWSGVPGAKSYLVKIRRGGQIWKEQEVVGSSFELTAATPGRYEWSVQALDSERRPGSELQWRKLEVLRPKKLKAPKLEIR